MKTKRYFLLLLAICLVGCATVNPGMVSTLAEETPAFNPDGTPFGPWIGPMTPWTLYNQAWYWNGLPYGFYGNGWFPLGTYHDASLVRPVIYYQNPKVVQFYQNNPSLIRDFHQHHAVAMAHAAEHHGQGQHHGIVAAHAKPGTVAHTTTTTRKSTTKSKTTKKKD
jgi:hypothetical protein